MLLASIIITFSALALGLLALLDRYESAADQAHVDRRLNPATPQAFYDAFGGRSVQSAGGLPQDESER